MQSDIELAVQWSKKLETLLEDRLGATGKGLHEKINSVQQRLPIATSRKLRFVATIRNKIVHETAYTKIEDRGRFERTCADIVSELRDAPDSHRIERVRPSLDFQNDRCGTAPKTRRAAKPSRRFSSSPWSSIVGGIVGLAVSTIHGGGFILALCCATAGVIAGLFWRAVLTSVLLALVIVAVFWLLLFAYHSVN